MAANDLVDRRRPALSSLRARLPVAAGVVLPRVEVRPVTAAARTCVAVARPRPQRETGGGGLVRDERVASLRLYRTVAHAGSGTVARRDRHRWPAESASVDCYWRCAWVQD